jgi:hypothetical protein
MRGGAPRVAFIDSTATMEQLSVSNGLANSQPPQQPPQRLVEAPQRWWRGISDTVIDNYGLNRPIHRIPELPF